MLAVSVLFTNGFKTFQTDEYDNYKMKGLISGLEVMIKLRDMNPRDGYNLVINTRILNIARGLYNDGKCTFEQTL